MLVDSLDGRVTDNELYSFLSTVTVMKPASDNIGNQWAQGSSGEATKAMGLVYQMSGNVEVLDQMIRFCDAVLSERNDLAPAPVGQHMIWTGRIDPVWPNNVTGTRVVTGGEQGDTVGHLAYCARSILQKPSIWSRRVPTGDPYGYGVRYLERAKTYVRQADFSVDHHILKSLLDLSHGGRYYFASTPYKTRQPVPWNQQMMFTYAFSNLAMDHQILGDDPSRAARYQSIVKDNLDGFLKDGIKPYRDRDGRVAYSWTYAPSSKVVEDSNHGNLDIAGLSRAYIDGRFGVTSAQMKAFADTFVDVMATRDGNYAGRVDGSDGAGHARATDYIRSGYLLLAQFRPDAYRSMMAVDGLRPGGETNDVGRFSRFLWVKQQRAISVGD
ncbi:hypothetical protein DFQ28_008827 [Apophysomyces sp. BC1034]|nr:hypothetical protein DFQ30_009859 [Apophysomyces sp. BC1015]KAG0185755.1 hypothetical protein DFQ28_008827 [Apophysomyces sp. BC1034]